MTEIPQKRIIEDTSSYGGSLIYGESSDFFGICVRKFFKEMDERKMIKTLTGKDFVDGKLRSPDDIFRSNDGERFYDYRGDLIVEIKSTDFSVKYNVERLKNAIEVARRRPGFPLRIVYALLAVDEDPDTFMDSDFTPKLRSIKLKDGEEKDYDSEYRDLIRRMWFKVPETCNDREIPIVILRTLAKAAERRRKDKLPPVKEPFVETMLGDEFFDSIEESYSIPKKETNT